KKNSELAEFPFRLPVRLSHEVKLS
ncbi:hypothetical protein TNCV_99341, partial [Trichonephila clavipes]